MLTEFSCGQPLCGWNFPSSETLRNHLLSDHSHDDICNEECYDVEMPLVSNTSDAESEMILLESTISHSSKLITDSMSACI